jgi:hypothetical protein
MGRVRYPRNPAPQTHGLQRLEFPFASEPFEDGQLRYLRSRYVRGEIDVDEFELRVGAVLFDRRAQTAVVTVLR